MSHKTTDTVRESCLEWLGEFGASIEDVLPNASGDLFIKVEDEDGFKTVYLPRQFQELDYNGTI